MLLQLIGCVGQELGNVDFSEHDSIANISPQEFLDRVYDYLSEEDQKIVTTEKSLVSIKLNYSKQPLCECYYELWIFTSCVLTAYKLKLEEGENND